VSVVDVVGAVSVATVVVTGVVVDAPPAEGRVDCLVVVGARDVDDVVAFEVPAVVDVRTAAPLVAGGLGAPWPRATTAAITTPAPTREREDEPGGNGTRQAANPTAS
jgi:hypothetical protein